MLYIYNTWYYRLVVYYTCIGIHYSYNPGSMISIRVIENKLEQAGVIVLTKVDKID